jgi:chaperonin cofactor prefoldin
MIKADKKSVSSELEEKKKILDLRIKAVDKQQKLMEQKLESMRSELQELIKKGN